MSNSTISTSFTVRGNRTHSENTKTHTLERTLQLISHADTEFTLKILIYGVTPFISLLGLIGNALSIKILIRHGLQKGSNIILVALAFSDICFLLGFNSFPNMFYQLEWNDSYPFSHSASFILYILFLIYLFVDYSMGQASLIIPMLITIERFIAVFFPLKCAQIVTPRRVWTAVGFIYIYCMAYVMYACFWFEFAYVYDNSRNMSVGVIKRSTLFYKDLPSFRVVEEVFYSIKIPPLFTLVGCFMIIVKLKVLSRKRMKMTNSQTKQATNTKTTQLLLAVCFFYFCICLINGLLSFLPKQWAAYSITSDNPTNMGKIMYQVINIFLCLNSSWNFTIYVMLNNKFRETFLNMIGNCNSCKK